MSEAIPDWKGRALEAEKAVEQLAQWMLIQSIPTGHGDSMEGLLEELSVWVDELREERDRYRTALEDAVTRMDRARFILAGDKNNWAMLDTTKQREALGDD